MKNKQKQKKKFVMDFWYIQKYQLGKLERYIYIFWPLYVCMYVFYFISQAQECITDAILWKIYYDITVIFYQ